MTVEAFLIWIIVGLVAGWLASVVVGGGRSVIGDIIVGVIGAFVGSYLFRLFHLRIPLKGLPGTILVAFVGSVVLLLLLRLIFGVANRR
jgi:uncharacterized membrane protein YeaQ/YmgE (transglycosylase-associated protein family)